MEEKQDHPKTVVEEMDFLNDIIPFRCPKCGDNRKFTKLGDLKLHLETDHSYKVGYVKPRSRVKVFSHSAKGGNKGRRKQIDGKLCSDDSWNTGSEKESDSKGDRKSLKSRNEREISPLLQSYKQDAKHLEMEIKTAKEKEMKRRLERNILDNNIKYEFRTSLNAMNTEVLQSRQKEWQMADALYQSHDVLLNMEQAAEKRCQEQQEVIQDIVNEFKFKESQLSQANTDLEKLKSERERLMLETENLLKSADKGQEHLKEELNKRENMLDSVTSELHSIKTRAMQELQKKEGELEDAKTRLETLELERKQLMKETEELSDKAGQHSSLLKRTLEVKERQLRKVNKEMEKLKNEQKDLVEESVQLYKTANDGNTKLKELVKSKDNQLSEAHQELGDMREIHNKLVWEATQLTKQADENNEKLKDLLRSKQEQLLDAQSELERVQVEQSMLLESAKGLQSKVEYADEKVDQLQFTIKQKEEQLAQRESELESIKSFLSATAEKESIAKDKLQTFITELIDRADNAERELRVLKSQTNSEASGSPKHNVGSPKDVQTSQTNLEDMVSHAELELSDVRNQKNSEVAGSTNHPERLPSCARGRFEGIEREPSTLKHLATSETSELLRTKPNMASITVTPGEQSDDFDESDTDLADFDISISSCTKTSSHPNLSAKQSLKAGQKLKEHSASNLTGQKFPVDKKKSAPQQEEVQVLVHSGIDLHDASLFTDSDQEQNGSMDRSHQQVPTIRHHVNGSNTSSSASKENRVSNIQAANEQHNNLEGENSIVKTIQPPHGFSVPESEDISKPFRVLPEDLPLISRRHPDNRDNSDLYEIAIPKFQSQEFNNIGRVVSPLATEDNMKTPIRNERYVETNANKRPTQDNKDYYGSESVSRRLDHGVREPLPFSRPQENFNAAKIKENVQHHSRPTERFEHSQNKTHTTKVSRNPNTNHSYDEHAYPHVSKKVVSPLVQREITPDLPQRQKTHPHVQKNYFSQHGEEALKSVNEAAGQFYNMGTHPNISPYPGIPDNLSSIYNSQNSDSGFVQNLLPRREFMTNVHPLPLQQNDAYLQNVDISPLVDQNGSALKWKSNLNSGLPDVQHRPPAADSNLIHEVKQRSTNQNSIQDSHDGKIVYVPYNLETGTPIMEISAIAVPMNTSMRGQRNLKSPNSQVDRDNYNKQNQDDFGEKEYQQGFDEQYQGSSMDSSNMEDDDGEEEDHSLNDVLSIPEYEQFFDESEDENDYSVSQFRNYMDENGIIWDTSAKDTVEGQEVENGRPSRCQSRTGSRRSSLSHSSSERDKKDLHVRFENDKLSTEASGTGKNIMNYNLKSASAGSLGSISCDSYIPIQKRNGIKQKNGGGQDVNVSEESYINIKSPSSESLGTFSHDSYMPIEKRNGITQTDFRKDVSSPNLQTKSDPDSRLKSPSSESFASFSSDSYIPFLKKDMETQTSAEEKKLSLKTLKYGLGPSTNYYKRGVILSGRLSPKLDNLPKLKHSSTQTWLLDRHITSANLDLIYERSPIAQKELFLDERSKSSISESRFVDNSLRDTPTQNVEILKDARADKLSSASKMDMNWYKSNHFGGNVSSNFKNGISKDYSEESRNFFDVKNNEKRLPSNDVSFTHVGEKELFIPKTVTGELSQSVPLESVNSSNIQSKHNSTLSNETSTCETVEIPSSVISGIECVTADFAADRTNETQSQGSIRTDESTNKIAEKISANLKDSETKNLKYEKSGEEMESLESREPTQEVLQSVSNSSEVTSESFTKCDESCFMDSKEIKVLSDAHKIPKINVIETEKRKLQSHHALLKNRSHSICDDEPETELVNTEQLKLADTGHDAEEKTSSQDEIGLKKFILNDQPLQEISKSDIISLHQPNGSHDMEKASWLFKRQQSQDSVLADMTDTDDDYSQSYTSFDDIKDRMSIASSQDFVHDRALLNKREEIRRRRNALTHIFSFLDTKTLMDVSLICKEWRKVSRQPSLWKIVSLKYRKISVKFLITISTWCSQMEHLTLKGLQPRGEYDGESKEGYITKISGCLEPGLERLLQVSESTLKSVTVVDCGRILTDKSIWLVSCYSRVVKSICYISDTYPLGADVMWAVGSGCRDIHTLVIPPKYPCSSPEKFDNKCLQIISECCHDLVKLSIGGSLVDINGLVLIAKCCQRLQELEFHYANDITEDVSTAMCRLGLNSLSCIGFIHTSVNDKAVLQFYKSCKHLKQVQITLSPSDYVDDLVTEDNVKIYKKYVEKLKKLLSKPGLGNILKLNMGEV